MKRIISLMILSVLIFSLTSCYYEPNDTDTLVIDYNDAASFENALNNGEKVEGKTVRFYVNEYAPDSILGINCHAGEHLNFISEVELDVNAGDIAIARVTEEPNKIFLIGSWKIPCEVLKIEEEKEEPKTEAETETTPNTSSEEKPSTTTKAKTTTTKPKPKKITVTMSEDELKNLPKADAEKKLREMGFTVFKYDTLDAGNRSDLDGKIGAVEIKTWSLGKGDFSKGDTYEADAIVVLWSYKYTEPEKPSPVFYSTNDYETAKKGNTGVFSYKSKSGSYDVYWIVDFDAGCVYNFTHRNGEDYCDKVKIVSGNLNDKVTITWHDGGDTATWYLRFKYVNSPVTLIVNDHLGITTEFTTTDLSDALEIRDTKKITER